MMLCHAGDIIFNLTFCFTLMPFGMAFDFVDEIQCIWLEAVCFTVDALQGIFWQSILKQHYVCVHYVDNNLVTLGMLTL